METNVLLSKGSYYTNVFKMIKNRRYVIKIGLLFSVLKIRYNFFYKFNDISREFIRHRVSLL